MRNKNLIYTKRNNRLSLCKWFQNQNILTLESCNFLSSTSTSKLHPVLVTESGWWGYCSGSTSAWTWLCYSIWRCPARRCSSRRKNPHQSLEMWLKWKSMDYTVQKKSRIMGPTTNKGSVRTLFLVTTLPAFISLIRASFSAFKPFSCSAVIFFVYKCFCHAYIRFLDFMTFFQLLWRTLEKSPCKIFWGWSLTFLCEYGVLTGKSWHPWHSIVIFIEVSICHFKPWFAIIML